jgi:hypothetical protein|tara:strand:- start:19 stop:228 length:210 start_codon:yes stop_codon:yes gene_type:complete
MSLVYEWKTSGGLMLVEYCFSSVTKTLKVVEMALEGKFHRINWMAPEGRDELMGLLTTDYNEKVGISVK